MLLSIVIVSWNTGALLAACIDSILTHAVAVEYEVIVVDNASTDGSPRLVRERFPEVKLLESETNQGFAAANNLALREAQGEAALLLNPDTELLPGALDALIDFMDGHPRVGAAGARLLNSDHTLQPSCSPEPTLRREGWRLFHLDRLYPYSEYEMARWDNARPRRVDVVQGAALIVRRAVLQEIGFLDEAYFMYSEEVDLCRRVRHAGWEIFWVPQSTVIHHGGQSTRQVAREMFLQLYRGKVLYFRKHSGALAARLYKLILLAAALARILASPLALFKQSESRNYYLSLAHSYVQLVVLLPTL